MTRKLTSRIRRVVTILPVAVLSAAWTVQVTGIGVVQPTLSASSVLGHHASLALLPGGTIVPTTPPSAPATVGTRSVAAAAPEFTGDAETIAAHAPVGDIPAPALVAYQRAESVIDTADPSCHLSWQLLAAIGRVESDHGRVGGSTLSDQGLDQPAVLGPVLDGRHGTSRVPDTDAGQYDHDTRFDRAVGPMQFLPSTWAVAGVDADGDGVRDPQDIDDAALASAVYLCSGEDDLSTPAGQQAAVFRYNHSASYVTAVLSVMRGYLAGGYQAVPSTTYAAGSLTPLGPLGSVAPVGSVPATATVAAATGQPLSDLGRRAGTRGAAPAVGVLDAAGGSSHAPTAGSTGAPLAPAPTGYDPTPTPTDPVCPPVPGEVDPDDAPDAPGQTSGQPVDQPTDEPTGTPTDAPTATPTDAPTATPTDDPTEPCPTASTGPTGTPTSDPTGSPTSDPAGTPTSSPTGTPTSSPSGSPTSSPTSTATGTPTQTSPSSPSSPSSTATATDPATEPTTDPSSSATSDPTASAGS